ncbi:hypothetical protein [Capnocytophaga sputigena]|uniref:hypothetical protein n=1 Tax=Capnocytophaga sputigena TaxID=1019 RepID=UPI00288BA45E|nr:hypothetical protein [Capnocytophaga sputigena]
MKRIVLLLMVVLAMGCSKSEDKQEPQKNEPNKEQQDQKEKEKANEQNKKDTLIYFALAKTSLNNHLNKNKEFDFWINTLKALEVSNGNEDVYKEVENFLKNNRFGTPRWIDSQQSEINKLIDNLKSQLSIINKYENIKNFINTFNQWR